MRKWILGALSALMLVALGGTASAQMERPEHPYAIRVGALWPINNDVQAATNDTWFNLGLDYIFSRTEEGNEWVGALDFGTASNVNYWAFQLIYMWRNQGESGVGTPFSFGVGGGVYVLDPSPGDSQTEFGIPLVAQWDLNPQIFLMAKYHWVVTDNQATGFSAQVGYRF
jgi:hypothetical protein